MWTKDSSTDTQPLPLSSTAHSCICVAVTVNTWHRGAAIDHKAESIHIGLLIGNVLLTPGPQQKNTCWVQAAAVCHLRQSRDNSPSPSLREQTAPGEPEAVDTPPPPDFSQGASAVSFWHTEILQCLTLLVGPQEEREAPLKLACAFFVLWVGIFV